MTVALYDASIASFRQTLGAVAGVLAKGEAFAGENDLDLDALVEARLTEDMAPFSFQIISVWHHSKGAIEGCKAGVFEPPPKLEDVDYARCRSLVAEALDYMGSQSEDEINGLADKPMVFRIGGREMPFTAANFLMSFSLPNFYFHATTTYTFLRLRGVPIGKRDFLGQLRLQA